jgi:hypothetical protein
LDQDSFVEKSRRKKNWESKKPITQTENKKKVYFDFKEKK